MVVVAPAVMSRKSGGKLHVQQETTKHIVFIGGRFVKMTDNAKKAREVAWELHKDWCSHLCATEPVHPLCDAAAAAIEKALGEARDAGYYEGVADGRSGNDGGTPDD